MNNIEFRSGLDIDLVSFVGGDDACAMSAWVSFAGNDEARLEDRDKVKGLINFLLREQHMTPFESSVFTFSVKAPIFVAREWMRTRSASYNEMSSRYTVMRPTFYCPNSTRPMSQVGKAGAYAFEEDPVKAVMAMQAIRRNAEFSWKEYHHLLENGVAKEVARMVLPVNIFTEFYFTINARNLMHFLDLRSSIRNTQALYEIRELGADKMLPIFEEKMPYTYEAWSLYGER